MSLLTNEWNFAKISVINSRDAQIETTTTTPNKEASIEIYENAEYWIDAKIRVDGNSSSAYNTITVSTLPDRVERIEFFDLPERQVGIIGGIIVLVGIVGIVLKRSSS